MNALGDHITDLDSELARALSWAAAWDMVRDAELPAREFVNLVCRGLSAETDVNLVTAVLSQAQQALSHYVDPSWSAQGWRLLADTAKEQLARAEPGSGLQLAWARTLTHAAQTPADLATLRGWLTGDGVPAGLRIDTGLRWGLLHGLIANGVAAPDEIGAELEADRTSGGDLSAAMARALVPTPEAKQQTWRILTEERKLPNWRHRGLLTGFMHPFQAPLMADYTEKFFDVVDDVWAMRDVDQSREFVTLAFPSLQIDQSTVDAADVWLSVEGHKAPLRRLVAEQRDGVMRALAARSCDARAKATPPGRRK
jgi:aminopeptidase N